MALKTEGLLEQSDQQVLTVQDIMTVALQDMITVLPRLHLVISQIGVMVAQVAIEHKVIAQTCRHHLEKVVIPSLTHRAMDPQVIVDIGLLLETRIFPAMEKPAHAVKRGARAIQMNAQVLEIAVVVQGIPAILAKDLLTTAQTVAEVIGTEKGPVTLGTLEGRGEMEELVQEARSAETTETTSIGDRPALEFVVAPVQS